jgi:para-nitrobenzyl esterase
LWLIAAHKQAHAHYWTIFVKTGDPNGKGLPNWPAFSNAKPQAMRRAGPVVNEEGLKALDA